MTDVIPISPAARHQQALDRFVSLVFAYVTDPEGRKLIADAAHELSAASMAALADDVMASMVAKVQP